MRSNKVFELRLRWDIDRELWASTLESTQSNRQSRLMNFFYNVQSTLLMTTFFILSSHELMTVLNSLSSISDGAYVCNCWWWLFWILNRREKRRVEQETPWSWNNWSSQHFIRLLISFHSVHIHIWNVQVIHVLLHVYMDKKETLPSPDVIFFKLHFFSSFAWRVLPFNVN